MEVQCLISSCRKSLAAHPHSVAGSFFIPNGCFATRPLTFFNYFLNAVKTHRSGEISVDVMETKSLKDVPVFCLFSFFTFPFFMPVPLFLSTINVLREVTSDL